MMTFLHFSGKASMVIKIKENKRLLLLIGVLLPLAGAYIAQYGFGLQPCILCLYQRIPYAVMAVLLIILLVIKKHLSKKLLCIFLLLSLTEVMIAGYHVGVEQGIVVQEVGCADESLALNSIEELRAQLLAKPNVACDKPAFVFMGLSMAAWNVFYALILSAFLVFVIKQEKK